MKLYGDVSQEEIELAAQLEEMEAYFDSKLNLPLEIIAKGYVCLAHDWFALGVEEEGHRLLTKADKVYPGYFTSGRASRDAEQDPDFAMLIASLRAHLNRLLIGSL